LPAARVDRVRAPAYKLAVENGDGRGCRAIIAHYGFQPLRHLEVDRARQAVRDQRRFERDDGVAIGEGGADGRRETD
jgi:hypothetical protein